MSMDGRYAATAGGRVVVAAAEQRASRASHLQLLLIQPFALGSVE